jgi:hypothetical protein
MLARIKAIEQLRSICENFRTPLSHSLTLSLETVICVSIRIVPSRGQLLMLAAIVYGASRSPCKPA